MNPDTKRKFSGKLSLILSAAVALTLATSNAIQAQTTPAPAATTTDAQAPVQKLESFVVTGSYLPPASLVAANPVTVIDSSVIAGTGTDNALQLLKRLDTSFTGGKNIGSELDNSSAGGESNVFLRNLDTLVLLDGRRIVSSPASNGSAVDLNTIPLAMIERIEVLKDGASTVYGSDAIGGVVNIITKKNFNGAETYLEYGNSGDKHYIDKTAGIVGGVSNDTTSITFGVDFYSNNALLSTQRALPSASLTTLQSFGVIPGNTGAAYYSGSYQGRANNDVLAGSPLAIGGPGYNASIVTPPMQTNPNAPVQNSLTALQTSGVYLVSATLPLDIQAGGPTMLNTALYGTALIDPEDRRQFLINADHKILGDTLEGYTQIMYADTINNAETLAPAPLSGVAASNLTIPANNPYNPFGVLIGVGTPTVGNAAPSIRTRLLDLGNRTNHLDTATYRALAGLKGTINEDYSWDASISYSRAQNATETFGGANGLVMNQLLIPEVVNGAYVPDPITGKPLSVYVSPTTGLNVPVFNYFAAVPGQQAAATLNALKTTLFTNGTTEMKQYDAVFKGTPFELPAGKVSFDVGAEYLRQDITSSADGLYSTGLALGFTAINTFGGGTLADTAFFGEIGIPIVSPAMAVPGFYSLDTTVALRSEKLSTGPKSTVPKIGVKWQPLNKDLTLRGTFAKAFESPALFDLFGPPVGNAPYLSVLTGNGSPSSGGASGGLSTGQFILQDTEESNTKLQPSTAETTTLGFVYSPHQVRGLTVSADYYHVHQGNFGGIDYTGIMANLNALGSASPYAAGFTFADGSVLKTTAPNQVTSTNIGNFTVVKNPGGTQWTDGLDLDVDYILPTPPESGKWTVGANGNILFNYKFRTGPTSHFNQYARQYTSSINDLGNNGGLLPAYLVKPYVTWEFKGLTLSVDSEYIPHVTDSGQQFGNLSQPGITDPETVSGQKYTIPSYFMTNVSASYDFGDRFASWGGLGTALKGVSVTVGANNAFNKQALYVPSATESNTDKINYDIIGVFYFVQVAKKF